MKKKLALAFIYFLALSAFVVMGGLVLLVSSTPIRLTLTIILIAFLLSTLYAIYVGWKFLVDMPASHESVSDLLKRRK